MTTVTTEKVTYEQDDEGRWWIPKDPDAVLAYSLDWTDWLAESEDTIADLEIVLAGATELTEDSHQINGNITVARISGGTTADSMQSVTFRITTTEGDIEDRTVYLKIGQR